MQSSLDSRIHIAIIMDGNRRWAAARDVPAAAGHAAGAEALRRVVEAAPALGVTTLTAFAFSADNWRRSAHETATLMALLRRYLDDQADEMVRNGIRFSAIGRRDRLDAALLDEIARAEAITAWGDAMHLRVAIDYSARDAILAGARKAAADCTRQQFDALIADGAGATDVDLLIRTGNEQRLSDFLLWECAYAELYFTSCMWPDFDVAMLDRALQSFRRRQRRFGGDAQSYAQPAH
jgi:undecaprenyl diphosphate synthase